MWWEKLKRVPIGLWAAIGVALALLGLYLRGRRLEAELARERLHKTAALARAATAADRGRAEVHLERARVAATRIDHIESARELATASGAREERRLAALPPDKVHEEYMRLIGRKRAERGFDARALPPPFADISVAGYLEFERKKRESPDET